MPEMLRASHARGAYAQRAKGERREQNRVGPLDASRGGDPLPREGGCSPQPARHHRQQNEHEGEPVPVVRCTDERRVLMRERLRARPEIDRGCRRDPDHRCGDAETEPAGVERDRGDQSGRECEPGAATEREVERRSE